MTLGRNREKMTGIGTKLLHVVQIAAPLAMLPLASHAQVVGGTPQTLIQSVYTSSTLIWASIGGLAGFLAGGQVWSGHHNWWHAAVGLLGGAALGMVGGVMGAGAGG